MRNATCLCRLVGLNDISRLHLMAKTVQTLTKLNSHMHKTLLNLSVTQRRQQLHLKSYDVLIAVMPKYRLQLQHTLSRSSCGPFILYLKSNHYQYFIFEIKSFYPHVSLVLITPSAMLWHPWMLVSVLKNLSSSLQNPNACVVSEISFP